MKRLILAGLMGCMLIGQASAASTDEHTLQPVQEQCSTSSEFYDGFLSGVGIGSFALLTRAVLCRIYYNSEYGSLVRKIGRLYDDIDVKNIVLSSLIGATARSYQLRTNKAKVAGILAGAVCSVLPYIFDLLTDR
jgi:hypothetical protein